MKKPFVQSRPERSRSTLPGGLFYFENYLKPRDRESLVTYLTDLHPIWETRYGAAGSGAKELLRPVYWLGNWQFASLGYYHPPKGIHGRSVRCEGYPPFLLGMVRQIERRVHQIYPKDCVPKGWELNTCLINYYGSRQEGEKWLDLARVGEHRDFEPGPVASLSLGERALFQFVRSGGRHHRSQVVRQMWLADNSLQLFGGSYWKEAVFHRVQRVEKRAGLEFENPYPDFRVRRINLTFRFVPREHWVDLQSLTPERRQKILPYITELAQHSQFFQNLLK